nr:DNA translocase FtsK [Rhodanobacter thiooxydans]
MVPDGEDEAASLEAAKQVLRSTGRVSIAGLQRAMRIGYNRSARIIEQLEAQAFVSPPDSSGVRTLIGDGARAGKSGPHHGGEVSL